MSPPVRLLCVALAAATPAGCQDRAGRLAEANRRIGVTVAAGSFLERVRRGDLAGAYATTSDGFRGRMTADEFGRFVAGRPILRAFTSRSEAVGAGEPAVVTARLAGPDGTAGVATLTLVEGPPGAWAVDALRVDP